MKQLFTMFALGWLCLGAANAQNVGDEFTEGNIKYLITSTAPNKVAVKGTYSSVDITIPQEVTHEDVAYAVTEIYEYAFAANQSATSITIPEGVTTIGEFAFYDCKAATINFPSTITAIDTDAFYNCTWYNNLPDGVVYIGSVLYSYKGTMPENTSIEVKDGIKIIKSWVFYNQSNLTAITLPEGVTSIGKYAFNNCSNLSTIEFPTSLTDIGEWALVNTAWENNLPDGVVYIGNLLYGYSGEMPQNTTIDVKDGTTTICTQAFAGEPLVAINIPNSVTSIGVLAFNSSKLQSITIPSSVTSIGEYTFQQCEELTSIEIPSSVTNIGNNAFSGCSKLATVNIAEGVKAIGERTFSNCTSLTSIEIPCSVTNISNDAFSGCSKLAAVNIAEGVKAIGESAFKNCKSLTSIEIPSSLTNIDYAAFSGCSKLAAVNIAEGVEAIGGSTFNNCTSLTSIEVPQSVTTIGGQAFSGCSQLASVTIKGAPTIDYVAFYNCALERLICTSETAPTINEYTFYEMTVEKIGVPRSSIDAYKTAENWSTFSDKIAAICNVSVASGNEEQGTAAADITLAIENETVTLTATATEGYAFAQWSDGNTDNPREIVVTDDISLTAQFEAKPSTAIERNAIESLRTEAGRVICSEAFRIYSLSGADVTSQNGTLKGLYIVKTATAAQKVTL